MKVALVANMDWALWHYRLPLAKALRQQGWEVVLICPKGNFVHHLEREGFRAIPWSLKRRSLNPLTELLSLFHLVAIYRRERPTVAHHFTIKPNIYGTIAARICGIPYTINAWTGLGWTFSQTFKARFLQILLIPLMRWAFQRKGVWSVFLNEEDLKRFEALGLAPPGRTELILSSGVDTERFCPSQGPKPEPPIVLMASRLLGEKGVKEFLEAARIINSSGLKACFLLAGEPDPGNPASIPQQTLEAWCHNGVVEFLGHREDMPYLLRSASLAVLPSYHEGVPLFLLEAMACGVPVVATDIPGCRAAVENGKNGLLVPPRDPKALAEAIERLLSSPSLREEMGRAGKERALSRFDRRIIIEKWLKVYNRVLEHRVSFTGL